MARLRIVCLAILGGSVLAGRADAQADRCVLLRPFLERVQQMPEAEPTGVDARVLEFPRPFVPWWQPTTTSPMASPDGSMAMDLENLLLGTLAHSARIRFYAAARQAAQTNIAETQAAFDWHAFAESKFIDTSEPVGNLLTTGGSPRYRDHNWYASGGFRRRAPGGGEFDVSQRLGYEDNNSIYFFPTQQGTAVLSMSFTRPLLRGAGVDYNARLIVLAQLDAASSDKEFLKQAQVHLLEVTRAYWQLYLTRAVLLQKRRLLEDARRICTELESRQHVDAMQPQILQARAAVARRTAEIVRAETTIRNTESRIRALVNDPLLADAPGRELIPAEPPGTECVPVSMREALTATLSNRSEIQQALNEISAARVKLQVAENELLPALNVVLETYAKGLEGNSEIGTALGNEFAEGEPSYTAGLVLDLPLSNRAAKARQCRQVIELSKSLAALAETVAKTLAETEIAVRDVHTAYRELGAQYHAMVAETEEVRCLEARWRLLAGNGDVATVLLDQLLQNQEERSAAEFAFASAQVEYNLALTRLKQAEGTLLQVSRFPCSGSLAGGDSGLMLQKRPGESPVDASMRTHAAMPRESTEIVPLPPATPPSQPGGMQAPGPVPAPPDGPEALLRLPSASAATGDLDILPASPQRLPSFPRARMSLSGPAFEGVRRLPRAEHLEQPAQTLQPSMP